MAKQLRIPGFRAQPKLRADGVTYTGRFVCPDTQLTGTPPDAVITFTITAEELADAMATKLLWTDQAVQRGIQPAVEPAPDRELCLADGYPDPAKYIFSVENADDMAEKLLSGDRTFFNPLVWNLRPGTFDAYWNVRGRELYIYDGKVYLPDSHHRHQAIAKAVRLWREAPKDYPRFGGSKQFKVELYFLEREDEGNYFFDKNQRPKPTAKSKAYDLTTLDDLSVLAKLVIEKSGNLANNVNRVTDRLIARNPQVMTLSTLREMMRTFVTEEGLDSAELEGVAGVAAQFFDLLADVRPELGHLEPVERRRVRAALLVDSAVMMHGYAHLMRDFNEDLAKLGRKTTIKRWGDRLARFDANTKYRMGGWRGDFFEKKSPLWQAVGVVKPGRMPGTLTVLNTGAARSVCGRVLRQFLTARDVTELDFLAER